MDADGEKLPFFKQPGNLSNPSAYVEQVNGLNSKLLGVIEQIVKYDSSARIILLGDHGYRYLPDARVSELESFQTFVAYRGQSSVKGLTISNQIFRVVLNDLNENSAVDQ